jgi:hypothetical protein
MASYFLKKRGISVFELMGQATVKCVKSSMKVKMYFFLSWDSGVTGPSRSLCTSSSGRFVHGRFSLCESFVCFPPTHTSHGEVSAFFDSF